MTAAERTVAEFIERINAHDVAGLCERMTDDHRFTDATGSSFQGRDAMRANWEEYLRMMPDFRIAATTLFARGKVVAAFGTASGTYAPDGKLTDANRWSMPAAWRAVVRGSKVAEWQVFVDNKPVYELLARASR